MFGEPGRSLERGDWKVSEEEQRGRVKKKKSSEKKLKLKAEASKPPAREN